MNSTGKQDVELICQKVFTDRGLRAIRHRAFIGGSEVLTLSGIVDDLAIPVFNRWAENDAGIVEVESLNSEGRPTSLRL